MYAELGLMDKARTVLKNWRSMSSWVSSRTEYGLRPLPSWWKSAHRWRQRPCRSPLSAAIAVRGLRRRRQRMGILWGGFEVPGQLAATMGRWQEAESHFDQAWP